MPESSNKHIFVFVSLQPHLRMPVPPLSLPLPLLVVPQQLLLVVPEVQVPLHMPPLLLLSLHHHMELLCRQYRLMQVAHLWDLEAQLQLDRMNRD